MFKRYTITKIILQEFLDNVLNTIQPTLSIYDHHIDKGNVKTKWQYYHDILFNVPTYIIKFRVLI